MSVEEAAGLACARRAVRLICADPGGRRTGFRLSARGLGSSVAAVAVAHSCVAGALARRAWPAASSSDAVRIRGQSAVVTAQQNPASSRATATATRVRRLPRSLSSRCQVR